MQTRHYLLWAVAILAFTGSALPISAEQHEPVTRIVVHNHDVNVIDKNETSTPTQLLQVFK